MHVTINERMLTAQLHKKEQEIKELKTKLAEYREQLLTMKDNLDEVKRLNKTLVNQISLLSFQIKQWAKSIPFMKDEMLSISGENTSKGWN